MNQTSTATVLDARPYRGGSRLYCPAVTSSAPDGEGVTLLCSWPSRAMTPRGAKAWRRHWRREHAEPFRQAASGELRFLISGTWAGIKGTLGEVRLSKGMPAKDSR